MEVRMPPGMPMSLVLMAFGIYVSAKYSPLVGGAIFLVGLVIFIVLWRRKNSSEK
jgi:ABC-type Mn2+/Zn2+ transport system permease subunit